MNKSDYLLAEKRLEEKFSIGSKLLINKKKYTIINSGKPRPMNGSGECKTDLYFECVDKENKKKEIKISIKLNNYEFLGNKTTLDTAKELFGPNAGDLINQSTKGIKDKFLNSQLIKWNKKDNNIRIILGWKLEIFNNSSHKLKSIPELSLDQKIKILNGSNSSINKINSIVNRKIIKGSGKPDFILIINKNFDNLTNLDPSEILSNLQKIENYAKKLNINFGFTAINYRKGPDKWDGDRALAVYIKWKYLNKKLLSKICFDRPLEHRANQFANTIRDELKNLSNVNINQKNYINYF